MIIIRNGKDIELTDAEIEEAYRERRRLYHKADLIHKIKQYCDEDDWEDAILSDGNKEIEIGNSTIKVSELRKLINQPDWMDGLEMEFDDALDNNDSLWESYWCTAEYVIENEIKERKG